MSADPIDRFTAAIAAATIPQLDVFAADAVVDATVPNWRWTMHGADQIRAEFSRWYADPGRFEELSTVDLPDGRLVEFLLTWEEDGERWAAHQIHRISVHDGLIVRDTVFCGGRWSAELCAEMNAVRSTSAPTA